VGAKIMLKSYADAFAIVESIINEEERVSDEISKREEKTFLDTVEDEDLHATKSKKQKSKINSKKSKSKDESEDEEEETLDDDESEEVETPDESPSTINLSDAENYDKFVDILNQFRAAHSFGSKDIKKELTDYFQKLTSDEKKVLHVFIKGLIQVTLMDVRGKTAYSPSDLKFEIVKKGSVTSEKKKSQARKIDAKKKTTDSETSTPIKIGEAKQNKTDILKVLISNR
jgi:hypothetical protein